MRFVVPPSFPKQGFHWTAVNQSPQKRNIKKCKRKQQKKSKGTGAQEIHILKKEHLQFLRLQ